eukprot:366217-Chlamydomonas_euryale.AAC.14
MCTASSSDGRRVHAPASRGAMSAATASVAEELPLAFESLSEKVSGRRAPGSNRQHSAFCDRPCRGHAAPLCIRSFVRTDPAGARAMILSLCTSRPAAERPLRRPRAARACRTWRR